MNRALENWCFENLGFEAGSLVIGKVEIWSNRWKPVSIQSITVPHPSHPTQMHNLAVYKVGDDTNLVTIAADEVSNGVWLIYSKKMIT